MKMGVNNLFLCFTHQQKNFQFLAQTSFQITGQKTKQFFDSSESGGSAVPVLQGLERKKPSKIGKTFHI